MVVMTDEQLVEKLKQMGQEAAEVMNFAYKKNKLDLFRAAEIEVYILARAVEIIEDHIT